MCFKRLSEAAETFTTAPFGANEPLTIAKAAFGYVGFVEFRIEEFLLSAPTIISFQLCPVRVFSDNSKCSAISLKSAGRPPALLKS